MAPPTMTARYERVQVWGIDCPERLTWRGGTWEPGGEYVRTIALKNVSTKTLKLKYRMPKTKYFELEFPEVITLSPGMSASVDVTFRPIKTEQYEDFVEFKVRGIHPEPHDTFRVAIAALLPVTSVALAPAVDLGYGAVRERIAKDFAFVNDGDEPFEYEWKIPSPCAFALSPLTGRLKPGETGMARAEFTPEDASVSVLRAALVLNGGVAASETKISAVGKFPYVRLSERVVDFGDVVVGKTTELCVWLVNQSVVGASYAIERVADDALHDHVFRVGSKNGRLWDGAEGRIDASGKEMIKLVYTPSVPGMFSTETFKFITPGGNVAVLLLKGTAIGPKVSLSLHKINFNSAGDREDADAHGADRERQRRELPLADQLGDAGRLLARRRPGRDPPEVRRDGDGDVHANRVRQLSQTRRRDAPRRAAARVRRGRHVVRLQAAPGAHVPLARRGVPRAVRAGADIPRAAADCGRQGAVRGGGGGARRCVLYTGSHTTALAW